MNLQRKSGTGFLECKLNQNESISREVLFSYPKGGIMKERAKEILLGKLKEMAKIELDDFYDPQGYAVLCIAMADLYNAICSGSD